MYFTLIRSGPKDIYDINRRDSLLFKAIDELLDKGADYTNID